MKTKFVLLAAMFFSINIVLHSCKKDDDAPTDLDVELYNESKDAVGFTYYKTDSAIIPSSVASGHPGFFRVRFNAVAQAALTDNGKLPQGESFPNGTLIVKELYESQTGALNLLAIMKKDPSNEYSKDGWVWAELRADGGNYISAKDKGDACVSCHSINHRDKTRLFDIFP